MTRGEALRLAWAAQPGREVDLTPLREAFLASGRSAVEVAGALGWIHQGATTVKGRDGRRVLRALGIRPYSRGHGRGMVYQQTCSYKRAILLAEAIGVDPVDVGL